MKDGSLRQSRATAPPFAPSTRFASQFKALATIERDAGLLRVRCLLQWLTRPGTFVFIALCLLLAPPIFFVTLRSTASAPPFTVGLEEERTAQLSAPPKIAIGTTKNYPAEEVVPSFDGAERVKERSTREQASAAPPIQLHSISAQESGKDENRARGGWRGETRSSWKAPVLPVEVVRDVPLEECLRNPMWDKEVDPSEYEFGCEKIMALLAGEKELIGNGNIRDVYLVEHKGQKLVVKALRDDFMLRASKSRVDKIHRWEAVALDAIKGHPNVVDMLGVCGASSVSEYYPTHLDDLILGPGAKPLPIPSMVSMALDAARGLQALHEAPGGAIVHLDIKPQQLMLDGNGRLKLNDLNMLRFADADVDGNTCSFEMAASRVGPFRSPENIAGEKLTEKVDIYSMAMVYYCMLALHPPYENVPDAQQNIKNGIPPPTDPSWHGGFLEIIQDMWQRDPTSRPSARRVVQRLEVLQKLLSMEYA